MSTRRLYRSRVNHDRFFSFPVIVKETDLWISVPKAHYDVSLPGRVEKLVLRQRLLLEAYLAGYPHFQAALEPCLVEEPAPAIVLAMARAANRAGVGPMAAVAGTLAEIVGSYLAQFSPEVAVENGGDIYIKAVEPLKVGIYAGNSPLSGRLSLVVEPEQTPLGVCTSSGTVGPSFSRGRADAAVALASSVPLADAAATAMGNLVREPADLEQAIEYARALDGLTGALVICRDRLAAWGAVRLAPAER